MRKTFYEIVKEFNSTFEEKKAEYKSESLFEDDDDEDTYYNNLNKAVSKEYSEILHGKKAKELTFSELKDLNWHELIWVYEILDWEWEMNSSDYALCRKIEIVRALILFASGQFDDDVLENAYKYSYALDDGDVYKLSHKTDYRVLNTLHSKYLLDTLTLDRDSEEYYIASGNLIQMDGDRAVRDSKPSGKYYEGSDFCVNWVYFFGLDGEIDDEIDSAQFSYFHPAN